MTQFVLWCGIGGVCAVIGAAYAIATELPNETDGHVFMRGMVCFMILGLAALALEMALFQWWMA
jgi:hypothetical protein